MSKSKTKRKKSQPRKVDGRKIEGVTWRMVSDGNGNEIRISTLNNEKRIELKLKGEDRRRKIGVINTQSQTMVCTRTKEKHLHILADAYGFNHYVLSTATTFKDIILIEKRVAEGRILTYRIKVADILEFGFYMEFKNEGFEKQIFIKREWMKKYITNII